ncbi:hypothetical protein [Microbacterium testaceum]|uniref:hypothetical protein n=1 Tax=Microbacterium testaceum TaxID=2033 RepID=UPI00382CD9D2
MTGSGGSLTLSDINVPAAGGSGTATASSAGATSASASLSGTPAARFTYIDGNGEHATTGVPSGSTPAFAASFLTSDGRLINGTSGSVQASNVDTFGQVFTAPDRSFWAVPLKKKDGTFTYIDGNGEHAITGVPSGSTPAFAASFLTSDGRLVNGGNGTLQASNVDTFGQVFTARDGSFWAASLKKKDGAFTYIDGNGEHATTGVPSGSTPAFAASFLTSDGRLINGTSGSVQASNVDTFGQVFTAPDRSFWAAPLKKKDGTFTYIDDNGEHATTGVPSGSTPAFAASFLTSDGRLINGTSGSVQASSVDTFGQTFTAPDGSFWAAPLKENKTSC